MSHLHFLLFQSRNVIPWIARWGPESLLDLSDESLSMDVKSGKEGTEKVDTYQATWHHWPQHLQALYKKGIKEKLHKQKGPKYVCFFSNTICLPERK